MSPVTNQPPPAFRRLAKALDSSMEDHGIAVTWITIDAWFGQNTEELIRHLARHENAREYISNIVAAVPYAQRHLL